MLGDSFEDKDACLVQRCWGPKFITRIELFGGTISVSQLKHRSIDSVVLLIVSLSFLGGSFPLTPPHTHTLFTRYQGSVWCLHVVSGSVSIISLMKSHM